MKQVTKKRQITYLEIILRVAILGTVGLILQLLSYIMPTKKSRMKLRFIATDMLEDLVRHH